jgi:hypothetical protein
VAASLPGRGGELRIQVDECRAGDVALLVRISLRAGGQLPTDVKEHEGRLAGGEHLGQCFSGDERRRQGLHHQMSMTP